MRNPVLISDVLKPRLFLKYWLPVLIWTGVIFSASSDSHSYEHSSQFIEPLLRWLFPRLSETYIHDIHELVRKCAHLTEYAVLALLLWRALSRSPRPKSRAWDWRDARLALLLVMFYAATDEFHQSFVPTRTSLVSDVFIDTSGGAAALFALWLLGRWRKHW